MNLDQQLQHCKNRISRLEECRRNGSGDQTQLKSRIEEAYQQLALLKIRQSMDMAM